MLNVIMPSVIMLNAIIPNVVAPSFHVTGSINPQPPTFSFSEEEQQEI
jgi:hypothetical protein